MGPKQIFKGNMSVEWKVKILESCVVPILVYGTRTWALINEPYEKLRVTQRQMERSILGIERRDRIKNENIRKETGAKDMRYTIRKLKIKYAGHVARQGENRWSKKLSARKGKRADLP